MYTNYEGKGKRNEKKNVLHTHTHVINMSVWVCVLYITPAIVLSGVDCFSKKHKMCKILIQFIIIFSLCLAVIFHPQNMWTFQLLNGLFLAI